MVLSNEKCEENYQNEAEQANKYIRKVDNNNRRVNQDSKIGGGQRISHEQVAGEDRIRTWCHRVNFFLIVLQEAGSVAHAVAKNVKVNGAL